MNRRTILLVLLALLLIAAGPGSNGTLQAQTRKLNVVTSTTILLDFARNVAGDKVNLSSLVPTDGDAHEYEPTPADAKSIAQADLVFVNGVGLEGFIDKLIKESGTKARIVTVTDGLNIQEFAKPGEKRDVIGVAGKYDCAGAEHADEQKDAKATPAATAPAPGEQHAACDPHMWQDVTNIVRYVTNIRDALVAADAANEKTYKDNAEAYVKKLEALDAAIKAAVATIPEKNRVLVTNHDALGYFAARYGFRVAGVVLPGGGTSEPAPKEVADLVKAIKAQGIPAIFTENIENKKLADEIARQAGLQVVQSLYTDALGAAGTPGETYLGMMQANLKTITAALGGKQ